MSAYYNRTRIHQTRTRYDLGLAAEALRESLHFAKLAGPTDLARASDILRGIGCELNDFVEALAKECGVAAADVDPREDFYEAAHQIAVRFDERRQEQRIAEDSDESTDRGCWKFHQEQGA
jgi:hypothetical protein